MYDYIIKSFEHKIKENLISLALWGKIFRDNISLNIKKHNSKKLNKLLLEDKLLLESLIIAKIPLYSIPDSVFNIKSIKLISIRKCGLKEIPKSILLLKNIEILDFSINELKSIPNGLLSLPKLRMISIKLNKIEILDDDYGSELRLIDVSGNPLKRFIIIDSPILTFDEDIGASIKVIWNKLFGD